MSSLHELEVAIVQPKASYQDALAYMEAQRTQALAERGAELGNPADYCTAKDFENFVAARNVWAEDAPARYALPHLGILLHPYVMGVGQLPPGQFMHMLTHAWNVYSVWLASQHRNPSNPNETKAERSARLTRERQARFRKRNKVEHGAETEAERTAKAAYDVAVAQRQQYLSDLDEGVAEAQARYHEVCNRRKVVRSEMDSQVRAARDTWVSSKNSDLQADL